MSKSKTKHANATEAQEQPETQKKARAIEKRPEDYSAQSLIAHAYSAGYFPNFTHQRLFHALVRALNGKSEGSVDFNQVLESAQMHRSSALQIIRHMSNFGLLKVSFNSSYIVGESRKSCAYVKILKNPEAPDEPAQEALPKSA